MGERHLASRFVDFLDYAINHLHFCGSSCLHCHAVAGMIASRLNRRSTQGDEGDQG